MDVLLLQPPPGAVGPLDASVLQQLEELLGRMWDLLRSLLVDSRGTRKEARQWLINALAGVSLADADLKARRFARFLPGGRTCRGAEHTAVGQAMLQLLFQAAPQQLAPLLADDPALLRRAFKSDPRRAQLWFGGCSMEGLRAFSPGASALANYALTHRAEVWHLLEWRGRHSQAPVAVAQRTHYFCELEVGKTVANLLRECPEFWESRELRQSIEQGAAMLLALDPPFWSKELLRWLDERSSRAERLYSLICDCLGATSWRLLCQSLLQLLPQPDLLPFANGLLDGCPYPRGSDGGAGAQAGTAVAAGSWLVFQGVQWGSLDDLLLAAAAGCALPLLLRAAGDEEEEDKGQQLQALVQQLHALQQQHPAAHWQLRTRLVQRERRREAAAAEQLRRLLLLHLISAGLVLQQLGRSSEPGSACQLQELLQASGVPCELAAAAEGGGSAHSPSSKRQRRSSSGHRKGKHKKRRRHKRPRRSSSSNSRDNDSSGGSEASDAEDPQAAPSAVAALSATWRLQRPGNDDAALVSTFELCDHALATAAAAYANWVNAR